MPLKAWPSLPGTCRLCNENVQSLQHHYRAYHQLSCKVDYGDGTVHEVFRDQDASGFPCIHCSKPFTTPRGLQDHARKSECSRSQLGLKPKRSRKRARRKSDTGSDGEDRSSTKLRIHLRMPSHIHKGAEHPNLDSDGADDDQPAAEGLEAVTEAAPIEVDSDEGSTSVHGKAETEAHGVEVNLGEDGLVEGDHGTGALGDEDQRDGTGTTTVADSVVPVTATEGAVERSVPPTCDQPEPTVTHPIFQPEPGDSEDTLQAEVQSANSPAVAETPSTSPGNAHTISRSPEDACNAPLSPQDAPATPLPQDAAPTVLGSADATHSDHGGQSPHDHEKASPPSSPTNEPYERQPLSGAASDDDTRVQSAGARKPVDVQPLSPPDSPGSESVLPIGEHSDNTVDGAPPTPVAPDSLAMLKLGERPALEKAETQAVSSSMSQQPLDEKLPSHHGVDDMDVDAGFFDLDGMELEYPSDDEVVISPAPEVVLPTVGNMLHGVDRGRSAHMEEPPTSRPVLAQAYSTRPCRDPLPPDHPVVAFLAEIDVDQPPPVHFARAFVDLGYDTESLLDMLACAKPECGDWDALQTELRTHKQYDAWWLRVKMALRERAARCLRRSGIFIRSKSA